MRLGHPLLTMTRIDRRFGGRRALQRFELEVAAGEVHGILGLGGSGKSTALAIAAGRILPDLGSVWVRPGAVVHVAESPVDPDGLAALDPDLLILDDPYCGLDVLAARALHELILDIAAGGGGVLMATHDPLRAERDCHRVTVLDQGAVALCDEVDRLVERHGSLELAMLTAAA